MIDVEILRHSLSHVMAYAVKQLFKDVKFAIGPAITDGFYYDFDIETPFTDNDLVEIEKKMKSIINSSIPFVREDITVEKAQEIFKDQPYKLELIKEKGENGVSTYTLGGFVDLCKGPHVDNTSQLQNCGYKLLRSSGAYWKGDEKNKMLQRIYAAAFVNKKELSDYLNFIAEAQKRDHRKLGPNQDLFLLMDTAPGMPYWLPRGLNLFNALLDYWRDEHSRRGYQEISSPLINFKTLWETSGHWEHYSENMFIIDDDPISAVKPMNCPNAMLVFKSKVRSYRELPLRLSDCDVLHRKEISGTLHGLMRVQMFRQDDSHNFICEDQISNEINSILDIADQFYKVFGLSYRPVLSTRPSDFMGDIRLWDKAEKELKEILNRRFGEGNYSIKNGDGAFYGPKIDLLMTDALNRVWQTGTIQLDFQLPLNFDLHFTNKEGKMETPVVVHRVIYGSLERFIGILIEHFSAEFPFWISPWQVAIVPVSDNHIDYCKKVEEGLRDNRVRVQPDYSDNPMGKKVNYFRTMKVPYVLILGDKEKNDNTVSLKVRGGLQINDIPVEKFISACNKMNKVKPLELFEDFN